MAIPTDINNRLKSAIIESTETPGVGGIVMLNPDGTNGGGGLGSDLLFGEDDTRDELDTDDSFEAINMSASAQVHAGEGRLAGIFVAAASGSPTLKVWDNTAASGTVLIGTFTPVAATMYRFASMRCYTGLYVTIGGTVDCTVFYRP